MFKKTTNLVTRGFPYYQLTNDADDNDDADADDNEDADEDEDDDDGVDLSIRRINDRLPRV